MYNNELDDFLDAEPEQSNPVRDILASACMVLACIAIGVLVITTK